MIECPHCKTIFPHAFERNDLEENQREERSMGSHVEYTLSYPVQCPSCGADLDIEVFEYPDDCFEATATEL